jgi:hypothetical protein
MHVAHIDVAIVRSAYTRPIVPYGIQVLRIAIMALERGIARREVGVPGAAAIPRSVNRRSGCCAVLGWP